jgi:phage shock protein E
MRHFFYFAVCLFIITGCVTNQKNSANMTDSSSISTMNKAVLVIDVRSEAEYSDEHIQGAINIPETVIADEIKNHTKDKAQKILLYCRSGRRAGIALETLTGLGYTNVENIGGYEDAKARLK